MRTLYVADDGTQFNTMRECKDYGRRQATSQAAICEAFKFFGGEWQTATTISELKDLVFNTAITHICLLRTPTDAEADYLYKEIGYNEPTKEGFYRWTEDEMWVEFQDEFNEFCEKYPMLTFSYNGTV